MTSPTSQPSDPCANLNDFLLTIKGISESQAFQNAEAFTSNFRELTAKVKAQEETMMTTRNQLIRAREELDRSNERLLRAHREETHKIINDKNELQDQHTRLQADIVDEKARFNGLSEENKGLKQQMSEEQKQTQILHNQIASLKQGNAKLESDLAKTNETLRSRSNKVKEQEAKIKEQDKVRADLLEKQSGLSNKLKEQGAVIKQIHNLAPSSIKDDIAHISQHMNRFWQVIFEAATKCFDTDIAIPVLEDQQSWKALKEAETIPSDMPFPPSNTIPAKRMRTAAVIAVLADLLVEHIFTPSYLFFDDEECRNILFHLATTEPDREKFLRRVLNGASKDKQAAVMKNRNESVQQDVTACVQALLDEKIGESLRATLSQVLSEATELWSNVQCMVSHFDTDVVFDARMEGQWRSVGWNEQSDSFIEKEIKHEHLQTLDPCLVLFPRVFVITDSVEQPVFSGIVLPRSETLAAKEEWDKIRQSKPMLGRSSTSRSTRPRRMTLSEADGARRSFLG